MTAAAQYRPIADPSLRFHVTVTANTHAVIRSFKLPGCAVACGTRCCRRSGVEFISIEYISIAGITVVTVKTPHAPGIMPFMWKLDHGPGKFFKNMKISYPQNLSVARCICSSQKDERNSCRQKFIHHHGKLRHQYSDCGILPCRMPGSPRGLFPSNSSIVGRVRIYPRVSRPYFQVLFDLPVRLY